MSHGRDQSGFTQLAARKNRDGTAITEDADTVTTGQEFFQFGGNHQHAETLISEVAQKLQDFRLGADIDPACRLIDDQNARIGGEPSRQKHLLLVTTRQFLDRLVRRGALDRQCFDEAERNLVLPASVNDPRTLQFRKQSKRHVFPHGHVRNDPVNLSVLGYETDPIGDRIRWLPVVPVAPIECQRAFLKFVRPKNQSRRFAAP